jgi:ribosomal protein L25 (general stress protein Ctc)
VILGRGFELHKHWRKDARKGAARRLKNTWKDTPALFWGARNSNKRTGTRKVPLKERKSQYFDVFAAPLDARSTTVRPRLSDRLTV